MGLTIKTIKNVLSESTHKNILETVQGESIGWYKGKVLDENPTDMHFTHMLYAKHNVSSTLFDLFEPLYKKLNIIVFSRVKLNCNLQKNENRILGGFHVDVGDDNKKPYGGLTNAIYYINNTDGKTLIKENGKIKEIKCEANSVVIFPNTLEHTGTTHTDVEFRYILNLNYV